MLSTLYFACRMPHSTEYWNYVGYVENAVELILVVYPRKKPFTSNAIENLVQAKQQTIKLMCRSLVSLSRSLYLYRCLAHSPSHAIRLRFYADQIILSNVSGCGNGR